MKLFSFISQWWLVLCSSCGFSEQLY